MEHDRSPLAAYALGALEPDEARVVDAHLADCPECRAELAELAALEAALGEVPPEAFLDGPPEGGDLMLQRTLRQVRTERARTGRRSQFLLAAGVTGLVAAALAGGALIGRGTAPTAPTQAGGPPSVSASPSTLPSGSRPVAGTDQGTGASVRGVVVPAAGWVRVHVKVDGVPAGVPCRLLVVPKSGAPVQAGSWLVSPMGEKQGTTLDGTALIAPNDVASVDVVTVDGNKLVSAPV
jgi:hypothetical protein